MIHKIESKAITHLELLFQDCDNLFTSFPQEDSVPLTDGEIRIYRNPRQANSDLDARVATQIKGQSVNNFGEKYQIERTYLHGLRASDGVLFLVTQILDKKGEKKKGFYRFLFPGDIDEITASMGPKQKKTSINLHRLPEQDDAKERIVRLAAVKQKLGSPVEFTGTVSELTKGFNLTFADEVDATRPMWFGSAGTQAAITARITDEVEVPITGDVMLVPETYFLQDNGVKARAGDVEFKDTKSRLVDPSTIEIFVSPGIRITRNLNDQTGTVTFTKQERVDLTVKDIEFLEAWKESSTFYLNEAPVVIELDGGFNSVEVGEQRVILSDVVTLFDKLGADISLISYWDLDEDTLEKISPLVQHVVYGNQLNDRENGPMRYEVAIGSWKLQLVVPPHGEAGVKQVYSLADPRMGALAISREKEFHTVTAYELLGHEELAETINLCLDDVVASYEARVSKKDAVEFANRTTLNLLRAADLQPRRRREFVVAAQRLNKWTALQDEDRLTNLLNRAQILWRQDELTDNIRSEIRSLSYGISGADDSALEQRAGCAIALGDRAASEHAIEAMSTERRKRFSEYPIFYMFENYESSNDYLGLTPDDEKWHPVFKSERDDFLFQAVAKRGQ